MMHMASEEAPPGTVDGVLVQAGVALVEPTKYSPEDEVIDITEHALGDPVLKIDTKYLTAARMSEIGLSQWEALVLMRQGFIRVFLPSADRLIFDLCATPVP